MDQLQKKTKNLQFQNKHATKSKPFDKDNAPRNLFNTQQPQLKVELHTDHYIHPHIPCKLKDFLQSKNFRKLCCEFYILRSANQNNLDIDDSEFNISKFAQVSIDTVFKKGDDEYRKTFLQAFKIIFSELNHMYLNIDSTSSILIDPYLEYLLSGFDKTINPTAETQVIKKIINDIVNTYDSDKCIAFDPKYKYINELLTKQLTIANEMSDILSTLINIHTNTSVTLVEIFQYFVAFTCLEILFDNFFLSCIALIFLSLGNKKFESYRYQKKFDQIWSVNGGDTSNYKDHKYDGYLKNKKDTKHTLFSIINDSIILPKIKLRLIKNTANKAIEMHPNIKIAVNTSPEYSLPALTLSTPNNKSVAPKDKSVAPKNKHPQKTPVVSKSSLVIQHNSQTDPVQTIVCAGLMRGKYPSTNIFHKDLLKVEGRHNNSYYIYWDKGALSLNSSDANLDRLYKIFLEKKEVRNPKGDSGIKRLSPQIHMNSNGLGLSYEIKDVSLPSRVYGFIVRTDIGFVIIFCHFDRSGRLTNH